jgi:hypothetical protein
MRRTLALQADPGSGEYLRSTSRAGGSSGRTMSRFRAKRIGSP